MSDPVESLRAIRKRRPWADGGSCPSCHHTSHAGRCHFVGQVRAKLIPCHCKQKREVPDDGDSVLDVRQPGAAVPVGDEQGRAPVTIHDVDRAMDALAEACARGVRGARA